MWQATRHTFVKIYFRQLRSISCFSFPKNNVYLPLFKKTNGPIFTCFYHTNPLAIEENENDVFGSIAKTHKVKVFNYVSDDDDGDTSNEKELKFVPFRQKNSAFGFCYTCKKLAKQGKLKECVEMLEQTMLVEQKVQPLESNFTVVMGALARNGNLEKVLSLFKKLKQYGLSPSAATFTAIFNAFSNSNYSDLDTLEKIYSTAKDKRFLNRISYNALLKAYSIHGSLSSSMKIFRESILAGFEPDVITFSYLLLACKNDSKHGARHALQIWKEMIALDIKPDAQYFMHFLQVILLCGVGNVTSMNASLKKPASDDKKNFMKKHVRNFQWLKSQESLPAPLEFPEEKNDDKKTILFLEAEEKKVLESGDNFGVKFLNSSEKSEDINYFSNLNVLEPQNNFFELESFQKCSTPSDRFQLIGGIDNMFKLFKEYDIEPTAKILTVMANLLEDCSAEEDRFIGLAKNSNAKLDADFFNCIILRRAKRGEHSQAKFLIKLMEELKVMPNYRTFCVRAMSCVDFEEGRNLINEIANTSFFPNKIFYSTLVQATLRNPKNRIAYGYTNVRYPNFRYLSYILKDMIIKKVTADKKLIEILERSLAAPKLYNRWKVTDAIYETERQKFKKVYKYWLKNTDCKL